MGFQDHFFVISTSLFPLYQFILLMRRIAKKNKSKQATKLNTIKREEKKHFLNALLKANKQDVEPTPSIELKMEIKDKLNENKKKIE